MKKLLLVFSLAFAGLMSAKESQFKLNGLSESDQSLFAVTRFKVTLKTLCGTLHETIYDTDFDSENCLNNEWEIHNKNDCGRYSYENPGV